MEQGLQHKPAPSCGCFSLEPSPVVLQTTRGKLKQEREKKQPIQILHHSILSQKEHSATK